MAKQTPGSKCDTGSKYELSVTALFASLLSKNENVEDYRIFSNLADAQPFDDIVAEVQFKGLEHKQIYAIQVKSGRDKLNINKYWKGYDKIMREGGLKLGECIRNNHIQFWYFCSKKPTGNSLTLETSTNIIELTLRPRSNPYNLHESIFSNTVHSELFSDDPSIIDYQNFFDNFSLFLNQADTQKNIYNIKGIWKIDDPLQILLYLENYFAKNTIGLNKRTFEHELLRNRLSSYMVIPTTAIQFHHEAVEEWNRLTLKQDVTIVRNELNIERYLFGCILQNVCSVISVDEWNRSVKNMGKLDHDVRNRLKTKTSKPETLKDLVVRLWIDGKAPLLLRTDIALPFIREFSHLHKSYVIIDSDVDKRYDEIESYGLGAFRHLGDVEARELMNGILVSIQGRKPLCLSSIINGDRKLMESVTCADVINLMKPREKYLKQDCLDGNNSILFIVETTNPQQQSYDECRPMGNNITKYCKPGESYENYKKFRGDGKFMSYAMFCLRSTDDERLTLLRTRKGHETAKEKDEEQLLGRFLVDQYGESIYNTESGNPIPIVGEALISICSRYIPRYLRQMKDSEANFLNNSDSDKGESVYNSKRFAENEFFKESAGTLTVITGEPGVGKTTLLHSLSSLCESQYYVVFVNLTRCQVDLHKRNPKMLQNPLHFWCDKHGDLPYSRFLTNLCSYHDRIVLLLDAFDEVIATCEEKVLELIQDLQKIGLKKIIIASRLTFVNLLTDTFKTEVFLIEGFNQQLDQHYIEKWNLNFNRLGHLPSEFLTNPLYLNMLRTISDNGINLDAVTNRWNLYKSIVALKMQEYCRRVEPNMLDDIEKRNILSHHWQLALEVVFGRPNVTQKLQQTKQLKPLKHNKFINLGFITHFDINQNPIFIHRTFAEFFVLQWLIENINDDNAASTYMLMLNSKMHMLDMLSEQFRLHKAVLHESVEEIEKLCTQDNHYLLEVDVFGRSALHLAAIICNRDCYYISNRLNILLHHMRKQGYNLYVPDEIMKWTWIDYWENHVYVFKWWKDEYVVMLEAYLNYYAIHIEKLKHSKFSLAEHFNRLYNAAIKYSSIDMIRDLLFLKYHDDKIFLESRDILLHSRMIKRKDILNLKFRGENLRSVHLACIYSNIEAVKIYIENRANFSKTDTFNCTPLHYSVISRGNNEIVKLLLANLDVSRLHAGQNNYTTILHMSVRAGNANITKMLLERVDANLKDADNRTALLAAIETSSMNLDGAHDSKHLETIEMLLQHKAIADFGALDLATMYGKRDILQILIKYGADASFNGDTLLYKAIKGENLKIIQLLLKAGACINLTTSSWWELMNCAIYGGNKDIVRMLLHYSADVNLKNGHGRTLLYKGIYTKSLEIMELLLKRGAHVNFLDLIGCSPLSYAIDVGNKDIVQMLLNYNTDVNLEIRTLNSATYKELDLMQLMYSTVPLHKAIEKGDLEIIELLLERGAHINILDSKGCSCLGYAVQGGHKDIIEMLLTHGADVNFKDTNNRTPLYDAIETKDLEVIALLLERGAHINVLNSNECSPLRYAIRRGNKDIVELLLTRGAAVNLKNKNKATPLYAAIETSNLEVIALLLERGAHINVLDSNGCGPLRYAVRKGNADAVEMLLNRGADVNLKGNNNRTPLYKAIETQDLEITSLLLERGAHISLLDSDGWSPLSYAVRRGNKDAVEMLLTRGADVNLKGKNNRTPLYNAIETQDLQVIALLLERGAHINVLNSNGCSPFRYAIRRGNKDTVELLLTRGAEVNLKDHNNATPLYAAIETFNLEVIALLLERGAHINVLDSNGCSPLRYAVRKGNADAVEMLLNRGADVNLKGNNNRTPLYKAIETQDLEIISLLLERGAHINILESDGWSPLSYAVDWGNKDAVEMLLTRGADVDFKDDNNCTPLYYAIKIKNLEIIALLLERGAHINVLNSSGCSPLRYAVRRGNKDAVELLLTRGAEVNLRDNNNRTPLYAAIETLNSDVIVLLLKRGAHINFLDSGGCSPLRYAVRTGNKDVVKLLLTRGAEVNLKDNNSATPLYYAIQTNDLEVIALLLEHGAHINILDSDGWSPVSYAVDLGNKDAVEMLLTRGADVDLKDNNNCTPLYYAIKTKNLEIIAVLLEHGALVNILSTNERSPLSYAVRKGNKDAVELLLSRGADVNFKNNNRTPLYDAIETNDLEIIALLLEHGAHINILDSDGCSPLIFAICVGSRDAVEILLIRGADVDLKDDNNCTPLYYAIKTKDLEIIAVLLRCGAHINILSTRGWSPLSYAVRKANKDAVGLLLSRGADVNLKNDINRTPLYGAIETKDSDIIASLVECGAHINILDSNGCSPLVFAVHEGNKDAVEMLLNRGADVNLKGNNNRTPLYDAIEARDLEVIALLLERGAQINVLDLNGWSPLSYAVHRDNKDAVEMLLTHGADVNFKDNNNRTPHLEGTD